MNVKSESEVAQSCPTLSDPMDCSPPGSSIHGIFQARVLEWGAIAFSETVIEGWYGYSHFQSWCILTSVSLPIFKKPGLNDGEGNSNPLQYSCLENPMDGGTWWAAVHGVAKSQTRLSDFTFTFHIHALEKEMATHSSVLAWRIPGTEEPGWLPSTGLHGVGHN